jgi:hypothetical protein
VTEIKLTLDDAQADLTLLREAVVGYGNQSQIRALLTRLALSIEEQVKPAIEEPKEFGSIVRAGYDEHTDRVLWVRTPGGWYAEESAGFHAYFPGLHNPEVLRVGIGERLDVAPEETEKYNLGRSDLAYDVLTKLRTLRAEAITSERKNAYDVAIATVEGLQP